MKRILFGQRTGSRYADDPARFVRALAPSRDAWIICCEWFCIFRLSEPVFR